MCWDADRVGTEGTLLDDSDQVIGRLFRELTCLIDLGVLTSEEEEAFSAALQDSGTLAARARSVDGLPDDARLPAIRCLHERSRMIMLLAADLDSAYQRLGHAA
jgi:hypothetical protein